MSVREIPFFKSQGFGNDFILLREEHLGGLAIPLPELAEMICARKFSVGADGMIIWTPSADSVFQARIFNADGSEAESSGNGIRCLAVALCHAGIVRGDTLTICTPGGAKQLTLLHRESNVCTFRTNLGPAAFSPDRIPLALAGPAGPEPLQLRLEAGGATFAATPLALGNPHCVVRVDQIDFNAVYEVGPLLERHPVFPARANVEFVRVVDPTTIEIAIWERGVGHTLSSGTGSAAAAVAAIANGWTGSPVMVHMEGGETSVRWDRAGDVIQDGQAQFVFHGLIESHALKY
jgi:diaminopimelate epimerase